MNILNKLLRLSRGNVLTLIEIHDEGDNIKSFRFTFNSELQWKAGQHGIFKITHTKIDKSIRPFSISSTTEEGFVQITTRIDPDKQSDFKKALNEMALGTQMKMFGPAGSMVIDQKYKVVLIAGGIGITPFRSIIENLRRSVSQREIEVTVIYVDSSGKFLFEPTIVGDFGGSLQLHKLTDRIQFKKTLEQTANKFGDQADYLISGSAPMVKDIITELTSFGISSKSIKKDPFYGIK